MRTSMASSKRIVLLAWLVERKSWEPGGFHFSLNSLEKDVKLKIRWNSCKIYGEGCPYLSTSDMHIIDFSNIVHITASNNIIYVKILS